MRSILFVYKDVAYHWYYIATKQITIKFSVTIAKENSTM